MTTQEAIAALERVYDLTNDSGKQEIKNMIKFLQDMLGEKKVLVLEKVDEPQKATFDEPEKVIQPVEPKFKPVNKIEKPKKAPKAKKKK